MLCISCSANLFNLNQVRTYASSVEPLEHLDHLGHLEHLEHLGHLASLVNLVTVVIMNNDILVVKTNLADHNLFIITKFEWTFVRSSTFQILTLI